MSDESGEKTEEPTQKKIDDSRDKGQVWKSKDLTGVAVFLSGMGMLKATWGFTQNEFVKLFHLAFEHLTRRENLHEATMEFVYRGGTSFLVLSLPVLLTANIVGILVEFLQAGPLLSLDAVSPNIEKLNPIAGMKNLFSKKQLVELVMSTFKLTLAAYVVYGVVRDSIRMVLLSIRSDSAQSLLIIGEMTYLLTVKVGLLFILFAIFDVWFKRRTYFKDLMMTKDEVKREYKESEGDPHHKMKRREMHMEILEGAQMESVKDADVVVTNPDHIAVALKYSPRNDSAPKVLCKGTDQDAERIKAAAKEQGIAVMRNVPLAHALLDVEVGSDVPEGIYDAVAEVLNFVYSLEDRATV